MRFYIVELDTGFHLVSANLRIFLCKKEDYDTLTLKEFKAIVGKALKEKGKPSIIH